MKNHLLFICFFTFSSVIFSLKGQTTEQINRIRSQYDLGVLLQLENEFLQKASSEKERIKELAEKLNVPLIIEENGTYRELQKILPDGSLIYYTTFNVNAARSTRTNHLNAGGSLGLNLMGQNMTAHIWDGGLARTTHQEYDGAGGTNRFSIGDGTTALHYHSAHVTGTIIASGVSANAKGMAPHARAVGYEWNNDLSEATSAAANGMLISNHSYGWDSSTVPDYYFGAYITDSRDWDNLLFNAPYYLMVVAAGNDGDTNYNSQPMQAGYDKLTGHATSKNNLVVANANDANVDNNGNLISVSINSSSSEGPTDDYRIKPDITGNGTSVYSTYETSNTAYGTITGTSMASPNVAGTLLLLQQHYDNLNGDFMRAATLKGLALHTADDAGPNGPDAVYGWGLLNAKKAAEVISARDNGTMIEELTLTQGQSLVLQVDSDGINELRASISWTDRAGTATTDLNNTTARLVNDLDLRITQNPTTYLPWRLTGVTTNGKGDNIKDPFERVEVPGASGTYTITITHKGTLTGGSQNYSLIVTGITSTSCDAAVTSATGGETCGEGTVEISVTGNGDTDELRLYTNSIGGTPLDTVIGNSGTLTTPNISQTTTFYVGAFGNGCDSPRLAVTATFLPVPSALVLTRTDNPVGGGECDFNYAELSVAGGTENKVAYAEDFSGGVNIDWAFGGSNTRVVAFIYTSEDAGGSSPEVGLGRYETPNYNGNWYFLPYDVNTSSAIPIDISDFSEVSLQFKHFFDARTTGSFSRNLFVDISLNGTNFSPLWSITNITADIPATNVTVDLSPYIVNSQVYIRFRYSGDSNGINDWKFDDVLISGNIQNDITWSPTEGLFTDAALSNPYTGGHAPVVYASPDGTVNYTASVGSSVNSCVLSVTEEVTNNAARFIAGSGNWDLSPNWSNGIIPDISKCVRVPNGSTLTVNVNDAEAKTVLVDAGGKITIATGQSLTVEEGISNLAQPEDFLIETDANLIQNQDGATNTGSVTVEKLFTLSDGTNARKQYNYVSSPVEDQNMKLIYPGNPAVIKHNETNNYFYNYNGDYIAGLGLAVKEPSLTAVPDPTVTAEFTGAPFNGLLFYPLSYTTTNPNVAHGYNLVGNPYPSNLDIEALYTDNQNKIEPTFYFWDNRGNEIFAQQGSNYNGDHYAVFNAVAGGGGSGNPAPFALGEERTPTKDVKTGTAFMIRALNTANGQTLDFKNAYRTKDSGPGFFGKNMNFDNENDRFRVSMTTPGNLMILNTVVYFEGGSDDLAIDDSKGLGGSDDFYSIVENVKLKIQGKAPFDIKDIVHLGVKCFEPGVYTLRVHQKEGIFRDDQTIYLVDNVLHKVQNLSVEKYTFYCEGGQINNRFKILYNPFAEESSVVYNKVEISKQNNHILIFSSIENLDTVEIYNLTNALVYKTENIGMKELKIPYSLLSKGILFIKVKTKDGEIVTKKHIHS